MCVCICIYNFTSRVSVEESVNDEQFCSCKEVSKKSVVNNFFLFAPELAGQPRRPKKLLPSRHQQKLKLRLRSLSKLADQDTKVNW